MDEADFPARVIVAHGRVYTNQGKYLSLKVFSRDEAVVVALQDTFGGAYYCQGKGWVWALSRVQDLMALAERVRPHRKVFDKLDRLFEEADKKPPLS